LSAVNYPDFAATVTVFSSPPTYAWQNGRILAGSNSPPGLSRIWASPPRHLWHYFHIWPLVQIFGRCPTVGSPCSSTPPTLGRGQVAPPGPNPLDCALGNGQRHFFWRLDSWYNCEGGWSFGNCANYMHFYWPKNWTKDLLLQRQVGNHLIGETEILNQKNGQWKILNLSTATWKFTIVKIFQNTIL